MQAIRAALLRILLIAVFSQSALDQTNPPSSSAEWHPRDESHWKSDLSHIPENSAVINAQKVYSLPELIDVAESHNPETRVVWERAKQQAAQLGISRSALYPLLTASALLYSLT
jgi:outer membrane protein